MRIGPETGPWLQTYVRPVISLSSRVPLLLVSTPVSITDPPNGQFAPGASGSTRTNVLVPSVPGDPGSPFAPLSPTHPTSATSTTDTRMPPSIDAPVVDRR